ncbi:MAG: M28 family peptidase [Planctomycetota bacterium]
MSSRYLHLPLALLLLLAPGAAEEGLPPIEGKAIVAHVKFLADDDRQGRAAGSDGARSAADYVAAHLAKLGLKPVGDGGTYFQGFPLERGFDIRPETSLEVRRDGKKTKLRYDKDLKPLSLSGAGDVTAGACFCGYGIAAPELGYDDYAGLDVKGKVVIVLRHAPGFKDRKSPFANPAVMKRYGAFQAKVSTAVGAGAAALVIVNDPKRTRKPKEDVPMHKVGGSPSAIPVFHVSYRAGRRLAKVCGFSLQKEQIRIDKAHEPRSRLLEGVTVHVNAALEAKTLQVRNVCGLLEAPRGANETLIIGAHFDHVGLGAFGSLAGSKGKGAIHNGADDNASGSSSVLEIATFFALRRDQLRRNVLFLWFTAEEMGLLGSKHYAKTPVIPLAQCVAMVNLDMVGRLERGRLQIGGTGTSPIFPKLLDQKNRRYRIKARYNPGGRAPSDNTSFYEKGMPVLFFFTGLHKDYHRPSDDWKRIDRKGIEKVARLAADVCLDLATRDTRPPFTRSDASGLSAGPQLGLSLEDRKDGVYVIFVEPKSPARRARFKVDDKIEEFENQPINTITNFNQVHSNCKEGQKVTIVIRRGPRLMTKKVTLGKN